MRHHFPLLACLMLFASCEDVLVPIIGEDSITPVESLTWTTSKTLLTVKGQNYTVEKSTGRDIKTGEIIVVEYNTVLNGQKFRCGTGTIENCRAGIERRLAEDKPGGHD